MNNSNTQELRMRNRAVEKVFNNLVKATKELIASQDNDECKAVVEVNHKSGGEPALAIYELTSPQFYLLLERDAAYRYWISFGMEQKTERTLNTKFLRLVFDYTKPTKALKVDDCVRIDHVFLDASVLFEMAAMSQSVDRIQTFS